MNLTSHKYIRLRIAFMGLFFFLLLTGVLAKAVYLQVFQGPWLSQKAARQYEKYLVQEGKRGTIFDRNGHEMAVSIEATSVAAHPAMILDKRPAARMLAKILKTDRDKLIKQLNSKQSFVWVKRQVTPKEVAAIKALQMEGIGFIPEYSRFYPNKSLAAQVIGFTGVDNNGLEGIEYSYDQVLSGAEKKYIVLKDALGRRFAKDEAPEDTILGAVHSGNNIVLTLDRNIQYIVESVLEASVSEYAAKSGMAVVMNPNTGAVLALANYPSFNPNIFNRYRRDLWRNRAITDPFEPGSTMKIFTTAAALQSGICSPSTIFYCENGAYRIGKHTIHDTHARGWLSLQQIVKYSSNIGVAKVVEMVGFDTLYHTLRNFGFGQKTGIDCPGETAGALASYRRWTPIDAGTIAFGQGVSVSAVQLITAASALANGGLLMRPYIVQAITNEKGRVLKRTEPLILGQSTSPEIAEIVKRIMQTVITEGGTGEKAFLDGYTVSGKTGTAQKIDQNGTYAKGKYVSSFLGFAPVKKPQLVVLIIIDEPESAHYGGTVAAPAFRKILHQTLPYLNIPPEIDRGGLKASIRSEVNG